FFQWFKDDAALDAISDEVAEIIREDLWANPLTYFNNEADEELESDEEGGEGDDGSEDDDADDGEEGDDEEDED
ncbi:hypothetical protein CRG98_001617, partial [Punica granatum]